MRLPEHLDAIAELYWPPVSAQAQTQHAIPESDEVSIVTAFFEIGRQDWRINRRYKESPFRRTTEQYLSYFANLAKIQNQVIVFTSPDLASRVFELRRAAGLEHRTIIFTILDLFEAEDVGLARVSIENRMTDTFRRTVRKPTCPEYNEPLYVLLNALKAAFACTAIRAGVVSAAQVAWIDFGYCRDSQRFDPSIPWRFDAKCKMNLFHIRPLDNTPVFDVVRSGEVYFQGGHIVGSSDSWSCFAREIGQSLNALLECDLIDDDQTLILMAWRRSPDNFITHAVDPSDWFVIFRRFDSRLAHVPVNAPHLRGANPAPITDRLISSIGRLLKKLK